MGLLTPGKETDIRAVRKAQKSMEAAERYILARNLDAAISELTKARDALLGAAVEPAQQALLVETLVRLSKDYLECGMSLDAANAADLALKTVPERPARPAWHSPAPWSRRATSLRRYRSWTGQPCSPRTRTPGSSRRTCMINAATGNGDALPEEGMELDPSDISILDRMIQRTEDKAPLAPEKSGPAGLPG